MDQQSLRTLEKQSLYEIFIRLGFSLDTMENYFDRFWYQSLEAQWIYLWDLVPEDLIDAKFTKSLVVARGLIRILKAHSTSINFEMRDLKRVHDQNKFANNLSD